MGRPAKFTQDQILDAALEVVAEHGPAGATMSAIATRLGAPVGSIYHRFPSRDLLLARLWARGVRRFQEGYIAALEAGDLEAAARHTSRWCREHLAEARVLLLFRREELTGKWPEELSAELSGLNREARLALERHAEKYGWERTRFALIDVPYGAVRWHLHMGKPPPPSVDELIAETVRALLR